MRKAFFALSFVLSFALGASAQDKYPLPKQSIVGAEKPIPLGELVDLGLSPIENKPANLVASAVDWKVFEGNVPKRVRPTGDGIFFGAGVQPKKLLVIASVSYLYVTKEGDKITDAQTRIQVLTTELQIGQSEPIPGPTPTPTPGPGPAPTPTPTPTLPDGRFGLAKTSFLLATSKVAAPREKAALAISEAFESIASSVAAGAYKTGDAILKATKDANNSALASANLSPEPWEEFGTELQKVLYEMYKTKKITTAEDYADAWREIATGLKAVK